MQIQRLQSLLLLIAAVLMGVSNILPIADYHDAVGMPMTLTAGELPALLGFGIIATVWLFAEIFMYKNLRKQMRVTTVSIVLLVVLGLGWAYEMWATGYTFELIPLGAAPAYVISLVLTIWARIRMRKDHDLLRSADRLR
jgi:hypothetical protein